MASQEIVYRISADNKQAVQAFNELAKAQGLTDQATKKLGGSTQQSNMLLMSTGRIVQDMPFGIMGVGNNITFLAEQFGNARAQGISFKDSLKGMMTAMTGPAGLIFGISTLVTVMTMMSRNTKTGESYTKDFIDTMIKGSSESEEYAKSIGLVTKALQGLTDETLNSRIKELTANANSMWVGLTRVFNPSGFGETLFALKQALTEKEQRDLKNSMGLGGTTEGLIQRLQGQIQINTELRDGAQTLDEQAKYQKIINDLQGQLNNQLGTTKARLQEIAKIVTAFSAGNDKSKSKYTGQRAGVSSIYGAFGGFMNQVDVPQKPGLGFGDSEVQRDFLKENQMLIDSIVTTANVLRSEFSSAWQDIFGEANSLFEKLMMNIIESMASNALMSLGGSLLNFLVPGLGTAAGMAMPGGSQPIQNNIIINDRQVATIYTEGKNSALKLRMN